MIEIILEHLEDNEWVPDKIELDIDSDFSLDDMAIDAEMLKIPKKLAYYGDLSAELKAQSMRKKQYEEATYALEAGEIRKAFSRKKERVTEGKIKEDVEVNKEYRAACFMAIQAEKDYRKVESFWKAMMKTADLAISLCYKQRAELQKMGGMM